MFISSGTKSEIRRGGKQGRVAGNRDGAVDGGDRATRAWEVMGFLSLDADGRLVHVGRSLLGGRSRVNDAAASFGGVRGSRIFAAAGRDNGPRGEGLRVDVWWSGG